MIVLPNNYINGQRVNNSLIKFQTPSVMEDLICISDSVSIGNGNDIYFDINNSRSRAYTISNQIPGFALKLTSYSPTTNHTLYSGVSKKHS